MNIEEIESKIASVEDAVAKLKELVSDAKVCTSSLTKTMISSAINKYMAVLAATVKQEDHDKQAKA